MSNEDFFNRIKSKLSGMEPDFDPGDWKAMEAMLDRKKPIIPLWMIRVAAGLALFVLGYLSYSYFDNAEKPRQEAINSITQKTAIAEVGTSTKTKINPSLASAEKSSVATQESENLPQDAEATVEIRNLPMAGKQETPTSLTAKINFNSPRRKAVSGSFEPVLLISEKKHNPAFSAIADPETSLVANPATSIRLAKIESPILGAGEKQVHGANIPFEAMIPRTSKEQKSWWIGMTAIPGLQYVQNPEESFALGVVAGTAFPGLPLSLEAGILKDRFRYEEAPTARLYLGEKQRGSQGTLSGISIPLKAKLYFRSQSRIQPYVSTGLTAFIPVKEQYVFSFDINNPPNQSQALEALVVRDTLDFPNRSEQEINSTLTFDFNSSTGNITLPERKGMYLLASAGAGMNFQVNARLGFQMSANYSRTLGGMGIEQRNMKRIDLGMAMHYFIN